MNLISAIKKKANKKLFTTPSHGKNLAILHKFYQWYRADVSEIDALFPQDALIEDEKRAAKIYGVKYTKFLTNGSTSGITTAVLTCAKNKKILIWNKAHKSHKNSALLANSNIIEYELPTDKEWGVYKPITPSETEDLILKHKPDAILITSPTYEGFVADVKNISSICKKYNVKLIVDEAHGALYPFSDILPESAVKYADYTVQSLHKTAGGINPTALLHSNDENPQEAFELITTTSPSYPMLATITANINYLNSNKGRNKINELITEIKHLRNSVSNVDFADNDITKILIKSSKISGFDLSEQLYNKYGIEDEKTNAISTMLLCGLGTTKEDLDRLEKVLKNF